MAEPKVQKAESNKEGAQKEATVAEKMYTIVLDFIQDQFGQRISKYNSKALFDQLSLVSGIPNPVAMSNQGLIPNTAQVVESPLDNNVKN